MDSRMYRPFPPFFFFFFVFKRYDNSYILNNTDFVSLEGDTVHPKNSSRRMFFRN